MPARPDWRARVESQGLAYAVEEQPDGAVRAYWHEEHAYELTVAESDRLEEVTAELHAMSVQAAGHLLESPRLWASLGLPDAAREPIRADLAAQSGTPSLYGRFDLLWDGDGRAKLLEYNADTPAGLVEAAVCQWLWLEDLLPERDQWNLLHERLVLAWSRLGAQVPDSRVHLAVGAGEPNEDWCTVAYLCDTAAEAGLHPVQLTVEEIGWDRVRRAFVGVDGEELALVFKMYPWEWMLAEPFGEHLLAGTPTRWVEPLRKVLLGSKTLLVALWECYPGHELLLPAALDEPGRWDGYVAKPVYGWEGAGIEIVTPQVRHRQPAGHTAGQSMVYQRYEPLPVFDGARPVLGSWVIGGHPAGLGIRESDGLVTDAGARFVPHYLAAPRSAPDQIRTWLDQDDA